MLGTLCIIPCIWQSVLVRLGVAYGVQLLDFREILVPLVRDVWFDIGYMFCAVLAFIERITHFFYVDVDSDCGVFLRSHAEWRSMLSRCFSFESLHALFWTIFLRVDVLEPA